MIITRKWAVLAKILPLTADVNCIFTKDDVCLASVDTTKILYAVEEEIIAAIIVNTVNDKYGSK